jgi:hypothetical protein
MFEFPFSLPDAIDADKEGLAPYVVCRLRKLLAIAKTLRKAGWPLWFTLTGVAFQPPGVDMEDYFEDVEFAEECAAQELAELGIFEEIDPYPSKTLGELSGGELLTLTERY